MHNSENNKTETSLTEISEPYSSKSSKELKAGILTFQDTINYGASLQAIALYFFIKSNCSTRVEIIDYKNKRISIDSYIKSINCKSVRGILRSIITLPYINHKRFSFCEYEKKHIVLSPESYNRNNICDANNCYDIVIVGSDQVLNLKLTGDDKTYFLDWADNRVAKYSYAASFGNVNPQSLSEDYANLLGGFKRIYLREKNEYGYETVLDPTFLLTEAEWESFQENMHLPKQYIFVYLVSPQKEHIKYVKRFAQKVRLPVVYFTYYRFDRHVGFNNICYANPGNFIYAVKHATIVLTNSFHGTAFSVNFKKCFYSIINTNNNRIGTLLGELGLQNRLIDLRNDSAIPQLADIEYNNIMERLDADRIRCQNILKSFFDK